MNKIFILGRNITMSKKDYAILYCNRQGANMFSVKRSYVRRTDAMKKFQKGVKFLEEDYDGYSYVALMHRVKLTRNEVEVWKMEAFADNVGVRHGW